MMGQAAGRIHDIPTVAEVIERTVNQAKQIMQKMDSQIAG
jgi:NAD(P)H-dependent flavin oxidoreductase YrpB (nitropropane dioxygenase family)